MALKFGKNVNFEIREYYKCSASTVHAPSFFTKSFRNVYIFIVLGKKMENIWDTANQSFEKKLGRIAYQQIEHPFAIQT